MKYRRKPLVVEAMLVSAEVMVPGGYLVSYPDGSQAIMATEQFDKDFEEIKRERAPRKSPVKKVKEKEAA